MSAPWYVERMWLGSSANMGTRAAAKPKTKTEPMTTKLMMSFSISKSIRMSGPSFGCSVPMYLLAAEADTRVSLQLQ